MTFLAIALAALREVTSREPQCVDALLTGIVGVLVTARARIKAVVLVHARQERRGEPRLTGSVTSSVR